MTDTYKLHVDLDNLYQPEPKPFVTHVNSNAQIVLCVSKSNLFNVDFTGVTATQKTMTSDGAKITTQYFTYNDTYKTWTMSINTTYPGKVRIDLTLEYSGTKITLPTVFGIIKEGN